MPALQPVSLAVDHFVHPERTRISSAHPRFSWETRASHENAVQHAFQIQVASSLDALLDGDADLWDSGEPDFSRAWKTDQRSASVAYEGAALGPGSHCWWRVRTWTGAADRSPWSTVQGFRMADALLDRSQSLYPPAVSRIQPVQVVDTEAGWTFVDFGKAAFGTVELKLTDPLPEKLLLRFGEVLREPHTIERSPGGSRRFREITFEPDRGPGVYRVSIPSLERNTNELAIQVHPESFEVMPFRYLELEGMRRVPQADELSQLAVHYPFNDSAASFASSNPLLDEIWEFCRYSIKATSFLGVYVDGDRERIPYEADAYIDGLGHIACDREYSMLRSSIEHLITQPTWPTEWQLYLVLAAWTEYRWTGDDRLVRANFTDLVAKSLVALRNDDGLVDTSRLDDAFLESIHYTGASSEFFGREAFRDVVDWPQVERDGHEIRPVNSIVNALHYRALCCLESIAHDIDLPEESRRLGELALATRQAFHEQLVNPLNGLVLDGIGSTHSSLHSNMFAAACGLLPPLESEAVRSFLRRKGMACSVYGSQILLEAAYALGDGEFALQLLTATGMRSWSHMLHGMQTTISAEAWDDSIKPNQDWNHAWGAAPAGMIPLGLLGVAPLTPGFGTAMIDPQTGGLSFASGRIPTVRGPITIRVWDERGAPYMVEVQIPANMDATVGLPFCGSTLVIVDGTQTRGDRRGDRVYVSGIGSGTHTIIAAGTRGE